MVYRFMLALSTHVQTPNLLRLQLQHLTDIARETAEMSMPV